MNYDLINKIAKRIVSFELYKTKKIDTGYATGIKKGIIFSNYLNFPVACGYKKGNNYYLLTCNSEKESYKKVFLSNSISAQIIRNYLKENGNNLSNFKKILKECFLNHGIVQKDDYLVNSVEKLNYNDFIQKLNMNYDASIFEINNLFQEETYSVYQFKINKMTFKSLEPINQELVRKIYEKLILLLPPTLSSQLLYGEFEMKNGMISDAAAYWDYDYIVLNMNYSLNQIVKYLIHELGHRWFYLFASKQQIKEFKKLFDNANGKEINLEINDVVTFFGNDKKYIYMGISENGKMLFKNVADTGQSQCSKRDIRQFDTINGQKIEKYIFPTNYSKTEFKEFVSECIAYCFCNQMEDRKLKKKIKEIIG